MFVPKCRSHVAHSTSNHRLLRMLIIILNARITCKSIKYEYSNMSVKYSFKSDSFKFCNSGVNYTPHSYSNVSFKRTMRKKYFYNM